MKSFLFTRKIVHIFNFRYSNIYVLLYRMNFNSFRRSMISQQLIERQLQFSQNAVIRRLLNHLADRTSERGLINSEQLGHCIWMFYVFPVRKFVDKSSREFLGQSARSFLDQNEDESDGDNAAGFGNGVDKLSGEF